MLNFFKNLFGDDFYLEMQRHKATVPRANHECYPLQVKVNKYLMEYCNIMKELMVLAIR